MGCARAHAIHRPFAWILGVLAACSSAGGQEPEQPPPAEPPPLERLELPHILLITVDALRADHLGLYGYGRHLSPNLDSLARESIVFERAYAAAPSSSYAIGSMLVGEHLNELSQLGATLPAATLATALTDAGYETAAMYTMGIFYDGGDALRPYMEGGLGFAETDHRDRLGRDMTEAALDRLRAVLDEGEPPTFLWVHYFDVHEPYRDISLGTSDLDRYDAGIRKVDREIGRLLREAQSILRRPIAVAVAADHGEELRDHGGLYHGTTAYDEQLRVPLILRLPGREPARVSEPVSMLDLVPTLLAVGGARAAASMRGRDLLRETARGEEAPRSVFAGAGYARMIVRWPFKLVALPGMASFELYDLARDPREQRDLVAERPEEVASLARELRDWIDAVRALPGAQPDPDPTRTAMELGMLRDPRAITPLGRLVLDDTAPEEARVRAARLLGGLTDPIVRVVLRRAVAVELAAVSTEAAIALGNLGDPLARRALTAVVVGSESPTRLRAAIALSRLRDRAAAPVLIEALGGSASIAERMGAIRGLGRVGDASAVEPLLSLGRADARYRYYAATALGAIGDRRAVGPLLEMLDQPNRTTIRDSLVRALGRLGDPRALPKLAALLRDDPDLVMTSESLIRLGAIGGGLVGGSDVGPGLRGARGLRRCVQADPGGGTYRNRTSCETRQGRVIVPIEIPAALAARRDGATLLVRLRSAGAPAASVRVTVRMGDVVIGAIEATARWREHRLRLVRGLLQSAGPSVEIAADEPLVLDHVLII